MKNLLQALAAILLLATQSCQRCDQPEEVKLEVVFSKFNNPLYFSEVIAEGAQKSIPLKDTLVDGKKFSKFVLPVNTNSDSTRYIFKGNLGTDTITIRYKRKFKYESNKCGFNVELDGEYEPNSTFDFPVKLELGYSGGGFAPPIYNKKIFFYLP